MKGKNLSSKIDEEIESKRNEYTRLQGYLNQLNAERDRVVQELLRLEGAIRALEEIKKRIENSEGKKST